MFDYVVSGCYCFMQNKLLVVLVSFFLRFLINFCDLYPLKDRPQLHPNFLAISIKYYTYCAERMRCKLDNIQWCRTAIINMFERKIIHNS